MLSWCFRSVGGGVGNCYGREEGLFWFCFPVHLVYFQILSFFSLFSCWCFFLLPLSHHFLSFLLFSSRIP